MLPRIITRSYYRAAPTVAERAVNATFSTTQNSAATSDQRDNHEETLRREEVRNLAAENVQLHRQIELQGRQLAERENDLTETRKTLKEALSEISSNLESRSKQLATVKAENVNLQKSLEDCKTTIFRLQPPEEAPDTAVIQMYADLRDAIEEWVEKNFADEPKLLVDFRDVDFTDREQKLLKGYIEDHGEVNIAPRYPDSYIAMAQLVVDRHFYNFFFDPMLITPGLDARSQNFVSEVEKAIEKLQPRRGMSSKPAIHIVD